MATDADNPATWDNTPWNPQLDDWNPDPDWQPQWKLEGRSSPYEPAYTPQQHLTLEPQRINWPEFWAKDHDITEWFAEPFLPAGRTCVLFAPAKTGKSLLALELAAAVATGRPFLDMPAQTPRVVTYLDFEMGPSDLYERLTKFGYGPDDDLTNLRYIQLPQLDPLDTRAGGELAIADAIASGTELFVIDTTVRAVSGDENASETVRDLFKHTLGPLKASGITTLRVDHAGKDLDKGQRGSSAKNDDADVIWLLKPDPTMGDNHYTANATHRRVSWIPETVNLYRVQTGAAPMHRRIYDDTEGHDGLEFDPPVKEAADRLDTINAPRNLSRRALQAWCTEHGHQGIRANLHTQVAQLRQQRSIAALSVIPPEDIF